MADGASSPRDVGHDVVLSDRVVWSPTATMAARYHARHVSRHRPTSTTPSADVIGLLLVLRTVASGVRRMAADPHTRGIVLLTAALILGGAIFYRQVEGFSWLDSFYFTVITLATVGYGDLSPVTAAGKLFTIVYVLLGIGILVALASEVAQHMIKANQERRGIEGAEFDERPGQ